MSKDNTSAPPKPKSAIIESKPMFASVEKKEKSKSDE